MHAVHLGPVAPALALDMSLFLFCLSGACWFAASVCVVDAGTGREGKVC